MNQNKKKEIERSLSDCGYDSNIWDLNSHEMAEVMPSVIDELFIEIISLEIVSKPCWEELLASGAEYTRVTRIIDKAEFYEESTPETINCHRFVFGDEEEAKRFALRVQRSARNKRKDAIRKERLESSDGYHTDVCLDYLFEIQQGLCYYTREPLTKEPKNYSKDHIIPLYAGGSNWPGNLALTLKYVNTWKGGANSKEKTLNWLAEERGRKWLKEQFDFCRKVDKLRNDYDLNFRAGSYET